MSRRWIGVIIVILGLAMLAGIIYVLFFMDFKKAPVTGDLKTIQNPAGQAETATKPAEDDKKTVAIRPASEPKEMGEEDLKKMAALFTERYGSYSNQSNYRNMRDLEIFMTSSLQTWVENFIKQSIAKKNDASIYYGITTKAISQKVQDFDDAGGRAKILVKTQRRESTGTSVNSSSFQQEIEIGFVKEAGAWKVDKAVWQNKQEMQKGEFLFR